MVEDRGSHREVTDGANNSKGAMLKRLNTKDDIMVKERVGIAGCRMDKIMRA